MHKFFSFCFNLLAPGSGLIILGFWRLAFYIQLLLFSVLGLLIGSRLIFEPIALVIFIFIVLFCYLVSFIICARINIHRINTIKSKYFQTLMFIAIIYSLLVNFFIHKENILGVHVFFIPSQSMQPTLQPGQFILIDTWVYHNNPPKINDVVVFRHHQSNQWLVKRIALWPNGFLQQQKKFYVLGDNKQNSLDSRFFEGIQQNDIVGQAKLILLGIDNHNIGYLNQFLVNIK